MGLITALNKNLFLSCLAAYGGSGFLAASASSAHAFPAGFAQQQAPIPVEVVAHNVACARLAMTFLNEARAEGLNAVEQELFTGVGTIALVNALQSGELEAKPAQAVLASNTAAIEGNLAHADSPQGGQAVPVSYIRLDRLTTSANVAPRSAEPLYAPLAAFLAPMVGAGGNVAVAMTTDELRYLPFAQKGLSVVVVARSAGALDAGRARRAAEVARTLAVRIYLVWAGPEAAPPEALMDLVASTGGAAALLGGDPKVCRSTL